MFEALAQSLAAGLMIWQHENANKYNDKLMKLRKEKHEEDNKPEWDGVTQDNIDQFRSDARLGELDHELCNLSIAFSSEVRKSRIGN